MYVPPHAAVEDVYTAMTVSSSVVWVPESAHVENVYSPAAVGVIVYQVLRETGPPGVQDGAVTGSPVVVAAETSDVTEVR